MGWIYLENIEIHAPVGVGESEKKLGNDILVTIGVKTHFKEAAKADSLEKTVDYEILYQIVASHLIKPVDLLETVAWQIADEVLLKIPQVKKVKLKVSKLHPPISGKCKMASIVVKSKRS